MLFGDDDYAVIENGGVGYKIFCSDDVLFELRNKNEVELYLYNYIREDQNSLFGFLSIDDLKFFQQLLTVSGVGPKTALNIFGAGDRGSLISAILSGDAGIFKKVSGIGGKTAERIVLELKNKVQALGDLALLKSQADFEQDDDFIEAMVSLGFSPLSAKNVLKQLDPSFDLSKKVRSALKILKK